jgi:hypothetical protein
VRDLRETPGKNTSSTNTTGSPTSGGGNRFSDDVDREKREVNQSKHGVDNAREKTRRGIAREEKGTKREKDFRAKKKARIGIDIDRSKRNGDGGDTESATHRGTR